MFAKDYRKLAWGKLKNNWGTAILICLLYALIIAAISTVGVGPLILGGPLLVGLCAVFSTLIRTGSTKLELLFDGFNTDFVSRMLAYILYTLYISLWSLLLVIPGIVKSYSYAMTFYIMRDNPGIGANEAITRSRQMMKGHKWQLFCLHLSFIGWALLAVLTFGILYIWVLPYMQAANAAFYESIKGGDASAEFEGEATVSENETEAL